MGLACARAGPGRESTGLALACTHFFCPPLVICSYHGPARAGPGWESIGLAFARTNPIVPRVAWDQSGLAIWVGLSEAQPILEFHTPGFTLLVIDHEAREVMTIQVNVLGSVCPSVCPTSHV